MARKRRKEEPAFSLFSFQDIISCVMGIMILVTLILALEVIDGGEVKFESNIKERIAANRRVIDDLNREIARMRASLDRVVVNADSLSSIDSEQIRKDVEASEIEKERLSNILRQQAAEFSSLRTEVSNSNQKIQSNSRELSRRNAEMQQKIKKERGRAESILKGEIVAFAEPRFFILVQVASDGYLAAEVNVSKPATLARDLGEFKALVAAYKSKDPAYYFMVKPSGIANFEKMRDWLKDSRIEFSYTAMEEKLNVVDKRTGHKF